MITQKKLAKLNNNDFYPLAPPMEYAEVLAVRGYDSSDKTRSEIMSLPGISQTYVDMVIAYIAIIERGNY